MSNEIYAHKPYVLSLKLRELIESQLGKQIDLMNHQIENILNTVYTGKYTNLSTPLTDNDKEKILINLKDNIPTSNKPDIISSYVNFINENFTKDEISNYINHCLYNGYKPNGLIYGLKISNDGIVSFLKEMNVDILNGFVIIKNYMNDALNLLPIDETNEHDKTSLISINDLSPMYIDLKNKIKSMDNTYIFEDSELLVLATDNDTTLTEMKKQINLSDCLIPKDYFKWGKTISDKIKQEPILGEFEMKIDNQSIIIPPDAPRKNIFISTAPTDVLFDGDGYTKNNIMMMDDESDVIIVDNGKLVLTHGFPYFNTDGGLDVREFDTKAKSMIKKRMKKYGYTNAIEFISKHTHISILYGFVGNINLLVKVVDEYDVTHYVDPSKLKNKHIYYDKYIMKKYGDDSDISVIIEIDGTYSKITHLTEDIYNSL